MKRCKLFSLIIIICITTSAAAMEQLDENPSKKTTRSWSLSDLACSKVNFISLTPEEKRKFVQHQSPSSKKLHSDTTTSNEKTAVYKTRSSSDSEVQNIMLAVVKSERLSNLPPHYEMVSPKSLQRNKNSEKK